MCNQPEYEYKTPHQIVPALADWDVFETEDSEHASSLFYKAYLREGITGDELVLHSDNGSPMKGATMLVTLQKLGVAPSFSRPGGSNDNPYSEALFKTLKYQLAYPQRPFDSVEEARQWVADFAEWYNEIHRHSEIKFVTPCQRHRGEDVEILEQRQCLYERMKKTSPGRWAGAVRNWQPVEEVSLNPGKPKQDRISLKAA